MKKAIFVLLCVLATLSSGYAQSFEGIIKYDRVIDFSAMFANNPNADRMRSQFGNMAEQARRPTIFELVVKNNETVYKADSKQDPGENTVEINGQRQSFARRLPKDETFYNLNDKTYKKYEEYAQQPFQLSGSYEPIRWKVDPVSTKKILDYECMKATATETETRTMPSTGADGQFTFKDTVVTNEIVVWFTDALESSAGPDKYNGLPGLVLGVEINKGATTYMATKIEKKPVAETDLKINSKGKKVNKEQLDKIKKEHNEERMKNFRGGPGGGFPGQRVIISGGN